MNLKSLQSFDWRSLQKYTSPKALDDFNLFLEKLPSNTSQAVLIMLGLVWMMALGTGLYTKVQVDALTEIRTEIADAQALKPIVPRVENVSVPRKQVDNFVKKAQEIYSGLTIKSNGAGVVISANSTNNFGQFREAIGYVQNGGAGWRVSIDKLCVGRECAQDPLSVTLKINKVSVQRPG